MLFDTRQFTEKATLTERQASYLACYKKNMSADRTAKSLGVSTGTAREQLRNIAKKLGLNSIREILQDQTDCEVAAARVQNATACQLMQLIADQGYKCALTGLDLTPENSELDHKVPRSKGGSDHVTNLQWLHKTVNRMKGNMSEDRFVQMCRMVADKTNKPEAT